MYLIFLDFDGVLITEQAYHYWHKRDDRERLEIASVERCCPIAISNLNYVCKNVPDCNIVISSTRRKFFNLDEIKELLLEDGFKYTYKILGCTPVLRGSLRGNEIQQWLEENGKDVKKWVAIDDHKSNIPENNLIHTKQETGFTILDAYNIIEIFNEGWQRPLFLM